MKYKKGKLPITDLINRNKIVSRVIDTILNLIFSLVRFSNKLIKNEEGPVVIISLHRLGDTIFTIPAVREIKKHYGQKLIIFCFPESVPIYRLEFNDVQFCLVRPEEFRFGRRLAKHSAKSKLKALKPEIIIDITGSMISALLIFSSKASTIVGFNRHQFRSIYDFFSLGRIKPHLVDMYLDVLMPIIQIPDRNGLKNNKIASNPPGKILIQPFAGWKEKEWNLNGFIALARKLNEDYSVSLITQNNQLSSDVMFELDYLDIELIQTNSIEELIKNIKECSFFIGNDSGPINMANFMGKPTFTIHGTTSPEYTATYSGHQNYTQKVLKCSAKADEQYCIIGAEVYNCPGVQCMNLLTVDRVYHDLAPLLEEYCNKKNNLEEIRTSEY